MTGENISFSSRGVPSRLGLGGGILEPLALDAGILDPPTLGLGVGSVCLPRGVAPSFSSADEP